MSRKKPTDTTKNRKPTSLGFSVSSAPIVSQELFLEVFMRNLIEAKNKHPEIYAWNEVNVLEVFREYVSSFQDGSFTRQAHAITWTCRELKIENSRESIAKIFNNSGSDSATENE
jgi:hypothetical protein